MKPFRLSQAHVVKALLGTLLVLAVPAGLMTYRWYQEYRERPEVKFAGKTVDLGAFYDWSTATGALADEVRARVTEPVVEVAAGHRRVYRLATKIEFDKDKKAALVDLRGEAYWSDGAVLEAQQVVDAWERCLRLFSEGTWRPSEVEVMWLRQAVVKSMGRSQLRVEGVTTEEELDQVLSSKMMLPIRRDLLESPVPANAWTVTLGLFKIATLPPTPTPALGVIQFVRNEHSYRGPALQGLTLDVYRFL